jgi:hypothetical protein
MCGHLIRPGRYDLKTAAISHQEWVERLALAAGGKSGEEGAVMGLRWILRRVARTSRRRVERPGARDRLSACCRSQVDGTLCTQIIGRNQWRSMA